MAKLKICGIRDEGFALAAAGAGVDFLGFIFAATSPRRISPDTAHKIREAVAAAHPAPRFVGVFTEHRPAEILAITRAVPLDVVQLHSPAYTAEDAAFLKSAGLVVWRLDSPDNADATLLDGAVGGLFGGTGQLADWSRIAQLKRSGKCVVLAGGISSGNIAAALATGADVIDVNSSLESSPGVKSIPLLNEFMRTLDAERTICYNSSIGL